jgi:hypothetical protein
MPFRRAHQPAAARRRRGRGFGDPRAQGFGHRNTKSTKISVEGRSQPMGLCALVLSVAKLPFRRAHQPAAGRRRKGRGYGDPRAQGFGHRNTKSTKISGEGRSQPMGLCALCVYVAECRSGGRTSPRLRGGGGDADSETRGPRDLATETQNPQRSPARGAPSPWAFAIYVFMWLNAVPAGAPAQTKPSRLSPSSLRFSPLPASRNGAHHRSQKWRCALRRA